MAELHVSDVTLASDTKKSDAYYHLCFYKDGVINYIPLLSATSAVMSNSDYKFYASSHTARVRMGGSTFFASNRKVENITYDIPAGTYTPSAFKTLISKFITQVGSSRTIKYAISSTVANKTVTASAGKYIYRRSNKSSSNAGSSTVEVVCMGGQPYSTGYWHQLLNSYNEVGYYIVGYTAGQSGSGSAWNAGATYYAFQITLNTGIKFT